MSFVGLPPEINSARIFGGAGSGPLLAAAAAWDGLAGELSSAAASFGSVTSGLITSSWQGAAAKAMAGAAAPYTGWLSAAAARAEEAAGQAKAVAAVFEAAQAATVHPGLVAANRTSLLSLVQSNLFGFNAPAIASVESQYEQMWAQDVAAMTGYHSGASAAVSQLTSWETSLQNLPALASGIPGPNLGLGNIGALNVGSGNTGSFNVGDGNTGNANLGLGNYGSFNLGAGNGSAGLDTAGLKFPGVSDYNVGGSNIGNFNIGVGNVGIGNIGFSNGNLAIAAADGNPSKFNVGADNLGSYNWGIGNTGTQNIGVGNVGNHDIGVGLNGDNEIGIGGLNAN